MATSTKRTTKRKSKPKRYKKAKPAPLTEAERIAAELIAAARNPANDPREPLHRIALVSRGKIEREARQHAAVREAWCEAQRILGEREAREPARAPAEQPMPEIEALAEARWQQCDWVARLSELYGEQPTSDPLPSVLARIGISWVVHREWMKTRPEWREAIGRVMIARVAI